jgi:CBS domain-containing protein
MQVKEIMTCGVAVVRPASTLEEAARRMKDLDIGSLPVCEDGRLVGVLTDRDIAVRSTAQGEDPTRDRVRDVMTPEVIFCFEDEDVAKAGQLMKEKQVRRLLVLNRDKRLVGILSLDDLAVRTDEVVGGNTLEGVARLVEPRR